MENHLKRLLEAESRAQAIIDAASAERQRVVNETLALVRDNELRFDAGRAELRAPFLEDAHARAQHAIAELAHKYEERQRNLREMAARHEQEAVDATLNLLLDPTR